MPKLALDGRSADELAAELGIDRALAEGLVACARGALELIESDPGSFKAHAPWGAPLVCGRDALLLPRTLPDLLLARRRLASVASNVELARRLLQVASAAFAPHLARDVDVSLSDDGVESVGERPPGPSLLVACEVVDAVAGAIRAELERQPQPAWKAGVIESWSALARERGARFDADALCLDYTRGSFEAIASVTLDAGRLTTRVEVVLPAGTRRPLAETQAEDRLAELGCEARVERDTLELLRPGLVASSAGLSNLLDAAVELAREIAKRPGPYR